MTTREEVHYRILKELLAGIDAKKVDAAFQKRFERWWSEFEPYIRRQLKDADFVKQSRFSLAAWVKAARKGFVSNLHGTLVAQMKSWALYWSSLPFELGMVDDTFDLHGHLMTAKRQMNGENLNVSLDAVFYFPVHAVASYRSLTPFLRGRPVDPDSRERYQIIDEKLNENAMRKPMPLTTAAVIRHLCRTHPEFRAERSSNLRIAYDKWVKGGRK